MKPITKDTLIIVFYINIEGLSLHEARETISKFANSISENDPESNARHYFLPSNETKVECINPTFISELEYLNIDIKYKKFLDTLEENLTKNN